MKIKNLFTLAALSFSCVFAQAATYALCIGINEYPSTKDENGSVVNHDLKGCVNDANSMKDWLTKGFSVPEGNIHLLLNKDADAEHFLQEMRWLINTAKAGDQIFFGYSGHGASVKDADEASGRKSFIVLADEKLASGKLFREVARDMRAKGVNGTFFFDSCFSGGMSRPAAMPDVIAVSKLYKDFASDKAEADKYALTVSGHDLLAAKTKAEDVKGETAFLFASKDDQPSSDLQFKGDKPAHGLFTYLFDALMQDKPTAPVKDMIEMTNSIRESINKARKEKNPDADPFDQVMSTDCSNEERASKPLLLP